MSQAVTLWEKQGLVTVESSLFLEASLEPSGSALLPLSPTMMIFTLPLSVGLTAQLVCEIC